VVECPINTRLKPEQHPEASTEQRHPPPKPTNQRWRLGTMFLRFRWTPPYAAAIVFTIAQARVLTPAKSSRSPTIAVISR
jgi:hypothetical protein